MATLDILNIIEAPILDESIEKFEFHDYGPVSVFIPVVDSKHTVYFRHYNEVNVRQNNVSRTVRMLSEK